MSILYCEIYNFCSLCKRKYWYPRIFCMYTKYPVLRWIFICEPNVSLIDLSSSFFIAFYFCTKLIKHLMYKLSYEWIIKIFKKNLKTNYLFFSFNAFYFHTKYLQYPVYNLSHKKIIKIFEKSSTLLIYIIRIT